MRERAFNIAVAKNAKYYGYQGVLSQWFINVLIKKMSGGTNKNENNSNKELSEELHKPIIRNFKKKKYTHLL